MMILTSLQRDFLDRFYTEMVDAQTGYATTLARKHGFTYKHFNRLWESYLQSWGGDTSAWGKPYPPLSPPPDPPIFPWPSLEALEAQLQEEEAGLVLVSEGDL
jgi:hypothetical protein